KRAGTACGIKAATAFIQAASLVLRSIGARHSAATRNWDKARLTQNAVAPACTSQMSDDTPPRRRSKRGDPSRGTSPECATKPTIAGSGRSIALASVGITAQTSVDFIWGTNLPLMRSRPTILGRHRALSRLWAWFAFGVLAVALCIGWLMLPLG